MEKRRVIIRLKDAPSHVRAMVVNEYPDGFEHMVQKIPAPQPFYALELETEEEKWLLKVDVHAGGLDEDDHERNAESEGYTTVDPEDEYVGPEEEDEEEETDRE